MSNALGTINPVAEIAAIARSVGALVVCDGAQSAPHLPLDFDALGVDFYAFSGHKMCGPMGIGVLVGRRAMLEAMPPYQTGGDMIEFVGDERTHVERAAAQVRGGDAERRRRGRARRGVRLSRRARHGRRCGRTSKRSCALASERLRRLTGCACTVRRRRSAAAS